jgi:uncharacterized protein YecE (DUF72 family)
MAVCDTPGGVRVGCCGFPISLRRYAEDFSVVEVQQTFYQPPALGTLEKWRGAVPGSFEFTLKAWQLITHESSSPTYRRLREELSPPQRREAGAFRLNATVMYAWRRTLECARTLGSRCVLLQCPARFGPTGTNKANLRNFFREIKPELLPSPIPQSRVATDVAPAPHAGPAPADPSLRSGQAPKVGATLSSREAELFKCVWEPRGEWEAEEVRELCEELGLVHCVDPFHQNPVAGPFGYFRLHGRTGYRYRHSDQDLEQLREMAGKHPSCYVLFNNISMLDDARRFHRLVGAG